MSKPQLVMAIYKPKEGKSEELVELIHKHFPMLKEYGLTTDKEPFIARSKDGSFIEIFEWASTDASRKAHDHPGVAKIWEAMAMVASFEKLQSLPENDKLFPHFEKAF